MCVWLPEKFEVFARTLTYPKDGLDAGSLECVCLGEGGTGELGASEV